MRHPLPLFEETLAKHDVPMQRDKIEILQINNGRLCNLACLHCHVEAGPKRTELMNLEITDRIIHLLEQTPSIHTLDITGGAPEMNPHFRHIVEKCAALGKKSIDRCNLTIFYEKGYEDLPEFLAEHNVHIIASLPCYTSENVDKQRGKGVFGRSIDALIKLNELGYGKGDENFKLDLVFNPLGATLPPAQKDLEEEYKEKVMKDFGISFDSLLTITNMPIKRFLHQLERDGKYEEYMQMLVSSFNPAAAHDIMCRNLVSISWLGEIYDCDFNQMLEIHPAGGKRTIWDIESFSELLNSEIAFDSHCFGCTAGFGSSCSGALS